MKIEGHINHQIPRVVSVAIFRKTVGYDYLASHLQRINVVPSPECQRVSTCVCRISRRLFSLCY